MFCCASWPVVRIFWEPAKCTVIKRGTRSTVQEWSTRLRWCRRESQSVQRRDLEHCSAPCQSTLRIAKCHRLRSAKHPHRTEDMPLLSDLRPGCARNAAGGRGRHERRRRRVLECLSGRPVRYRRRHTPPLTVTVSDGPGVWLCIADEWPMMNDTLRLVCCEHWRADIADMCCDGWRIDGWCKHAPLTDWPTTGSQSPLPLKNNWSLVR